MSPQRKSALAAVESEVQRCSIQVASLSLAFGPGRHFCWFLHESGWSWCQVHDLQGLSSSPVDAPLDSFETPNLQRLQMHARLFAIFPACLYLRADSLADWRYKLDRANCHRTVKETQQISARFTWISSVFQPYFDFTSLALGTDVSIPLISMKIPWTSRWRSLPCFRSVLSSFCPLG